MKYTRSLRYFYSAVLVLLFGSSPHAALAQTPTFNIEGVVSDAQQAVLPGAGLPPLIRSVA